MTIDRQYQSHDPPERYLCCGMAFRPIWPGPSNPSVEKFILNSFCVFPNKGPGVNQISIRVRMVAQVSDEKREQVRKALHDAGAKQETVNEIEEGDLDVLFLNGWISFSMHSEICSLLRDSLQVLWVLSCTCRKVSPAS